MKLTKSMAPNRTHYFYTLTGDEDEVKRAVNAFEAKRMELRADLVDVDEEDGVHSAEIAVHKLHARQLGYFLKELTR